MVRSTKPGELTPKQEEGIFALLNQPTVRKAAEAICVHEQTLHRWLEEPDFMRAYRTARRLVFSQSVAMNQKYLALAINTLASVMSDKAAPHSARVSAAAAVIKFGRESLEMDDLAERVEAIEKLSAEQAALNKNRAP